MVTRKYLSILFLIMLFLSACNQPTPAPKQIPTDPPSPETGADVTQSLSPTTSPFPTFTDTLTPSDTSPPPAPTTQQIPTEQIPTAPEGEPITRFSSGQEITIYQIQMTDENQGWAIAVADSDTEHILRTDDGGATWQDVTPPQPLNQNGTSLQVDGFFWDANTAWVAYQGSKWAWSTGDGGTSWTAAPLTYETLGGALFAALDNRFVWLFQFLDAGMQKVYTAVYQSNDGGQTWDLLLDPTGDITIQSFDKTGAQFANLKYGWLTRDFRGVQPIVQLDVTIDGGENWQPGQLPPPPTAPDIFQECACGLYDPHMKEQGKGIFRLACKCFENDQLITRNFLYRTTNLGSNWSVEPLPEGTLYQISDQILYTIGRKINRSENGGRTWTEVKTVFWDGQFSFINQEVAWAVAYDPDDEEYALVKTEDGCETFVEIEPIIP